MHRRRGSRKGGDGDGDGGADSPKSKRLQDRAASSFQIEVLALLLLTAWYSLLLWIAARYVHNGYLEALPESAPLSKFSEGRAMRHVWQLAHEIGGRQEGTPGLTQAAEYLKGEISKLKLRADSVRVELDESFVSGSFNMNFLRHNVAMAYRNHTNIAVRVSGVADDKPAVLVSGHFDSPLGSPGAGDCASCVASMMEVLRYIVDTKWTPPVPIIFLFNGAEEVFLVAAHGFVTTHKWSSTIGAVINVEATGASGPDLVVQSGPETWPTRVYAESALVPGANSVAQDVFPFVPGDTDYRIFSQDFADIPGLDIVFLLKGYVYHTAYDRPENIVPGAIQTRGENLIALLKGFTNSSELRTATERAEAGGSDTERHVFFDVLGLFMVHYSRKTAFLLHVIPLLTVLTVPYLSAKNFGSLTRAYLAIFEAGLVQGLGCLLAVIFPIILAILTQVFSTTAMRWFAHPLLAVATFVPTAFAGLLVPRVVWRPKLLSSQDAIWTSHWGALAFHGLEAAVFTFSGAMSGYFPFWWALFMIPAFHSLTYFENKFGRHSIRSMFGYFLPAVLPSIYSVFFVSVFVQFIAEKLGMIGGHPDPIGFFLGDVAMAAVLGLGVVACAGHIVPGVAHILAKPRIIMLLLATSLGISIGFSGTFPYSVSAPKRIILQHTFKTTGDAITERSYDFSTVDPNTMTFVFKHAPDVLQSLKSNPKLSEESAAATFLALYPISLMLSRTYKVPTGAGPPYKDQFSLPKLRHIELDAGTSGNRRLLLELDLGSLQEVWGTAINITGPLAKWSFSDQKLPDTEVVDNGPPSYICRFSGQTRNENWKFWVETNGSDPLRIELAVLDQQLADATISLMDKFPPWAAVVAGTAYLSSYVF